MAVGHDQDEAARPAPPQGVRRDRRAGGSSTLPGRCAGKASGRGSIQVTAKGSGASASTRARPTWPAPKRRSGRRSSPKPSVSTPPARRRAAGPDRSIGPARCARRRIARDAARGGEDAGRLALARSRRRASRSLRSNTSMSRSHLAAAALAELGAESEIARARALRGAGRGERGLRQRNRPPFERAAADRAGEAAVRPYDQPGAGLARRRAARSRRRSPWRRGRGASSASQEPRPDAASARLHPWSRGSRA